MLKGLLNRMPGKYYSTLSEIKQSLLKNSLIAKILHDSYAENPSLKSIAVETLLQIIRSGLEEVIQLEELAWFHKRLNLPLKSEAACQIKAVIVLSGPGTWYLEKKEDRYKDKVWAAWMDRKRLVHAVWVIRRITEISTGRCFRASLDTLDEQVCKIRASIAEYGPYFIYTGREDERQAVKQALQENRVIIPPEKVYIIEGKIDNTVEQVRTITLPPELCLEPGDRIAVVAHSPQLVRFGRILGQYRPFPPEVEIQPFPLSIPCTGMSDYPEQEMRGLLYYTFIRKDATQVPYPYILE